MKKILIVALALLLAFATAACGNKDDGGDTSDGGDNSGADKKVELHFGSTVATTHAWYRAAEEFKAEVEEKSGGSIEIILDFGGVHGSDKDHCEAVRAGTLDMAIDSTVGLDAVVTKLGFVNLPYLMTSIEDVESKFYNGWMGETATRLMEEEGMTVIGWTDCDFRWMTNSTKPIKSVDDLKGMKMRVPEAPMYLQFFTNLGTVPTPIAFTDLPGALQQKTVDGQDNGPVLTYTAGLYEFQKYMTRSNHAFAAAGFYINTEKLNSLSENQKSILLEAGSTYVDKTKEYLRADTEDFAKEMEGSCEIIDVTPELDEAMRTAAEKVWQDTSVTGKFDQDAVNKILEEAGL